MPEYTYDDGDEEGAAEEAKKRINLRKYASTPDANIRDVFWSIMAAYTMKKDMKNEIKQFNNSRSALMQIALSVLKNPESAYYGLSLNFIGLYTLMMALDGEWGDVFRGLLMKSYADNGKPIGPIKNALKKLFTNKNYNEKIVRYMKRMILSSDSIGPLLAYVKEMKERQLVVVLKSELMIIARSHVGEIQRDAMDCLALIKDDDARMVLISLLSHWDEETKKKAADILDDVDDERAIAAAKRQLAVESNPQIKKLLSRLAEKKVG